MSKIEVNAIEPQCGTTLTVGAAGTTVTVPSNVVKSNALQASDAGNIISQSGTTITLGATGDSINLASGATQSGFGRTGTVDWDTTAKTTGFTAVSGNGYFMNTTSGPLTLTLPASPSAGDIVAIADYNGTALTNAITIGRNSSDINGSATDLTINANYSAVTLVYVDATSGWRSVDSSNPSDIETPPEYMAATGGTITTCGDYKIHTFTGPGTFTVSCGGNSVGSDSVDYLVVAGGGSGGESINYPTAYGGAGGGAGGYRESSGTASGCYTASPLGACVSALPVTVTGYPITIGGGGSGGPNTRNSGANSIFSTITSAGGGAGGNCNSPAPVNHGLPGGSGGGGGAIGLGGTGTSGTGNTPPVSPPQGNNGGTGGGSGGGGGGATVAGSNSTSPTGSTGGAGATSSINATPTARAGGGGSGGPGGSGAGGTGGGAAGGSPNSPGPSASANTGGGGGGGGGGTGCVNSGSGGSGIVIIRYKFQ